MSIDEGFPSDKMKNRQSPEKPVLNPEDGQGVILDSIADGVFTVDPDWRITSFNRAAEKSPAFPGTRPSDSSARMS